MNKTKEWHKDISNSEVAQEVKKALDEMPKESWEEELSNKFGWEGQFGKNSGAEKAVKQFIKKTLQQQESKYLKVLRDIVGEEKYKTGLLEDEGFIMGYNQKRQEEIEIIKDNNIEL